MTSALAILAIVIGGLLVVVLVLAAIVVGMYNRLITLRNRYKNAFSQIDVQLKRRYNLIPNLVEVAKGYIKHERETLEAVIQARNAAYSAGQQAASNPGNRETMTALGGAEGQLTGAGPIVRRRRGLSRSESQSEYDGLARGAFLDREQDRLRPPVVQRLGDELQHTARGVPDGDYRLDVQLPRGASVRDRAGCRANGAQGFVQLTMATDFFDRQDHARRLTRRLVVMFAFSVVAIILAIYFVLALAETAYEQQAEPLRSDHHTTSLGDDTTNWPYHEQTQAETHRPVEPTLWRPILFLWVTLGTTLVITIGSLYKISELAGGGESVALMLGGRAVNPHTTDLAERRLLNVVEEMALASGVPVPPVYVLDREPGINAFAAGHQPGNAVVAVSAGCLQCLTREELQGVMGHEFSHILNGDMRLNLRLIGVVNGILVLAHHRLLHTPLGRPYMSSRDSKEGGGAAAILGLGLALVIFGYLGVFFGNLIKSAISRQREFLADSSSVQFTRNPARFGRGAEEDRRTQRRLAHPRRARP